MRYDSTAASAICAMQGSVRDALDCGLLCSPGSYMAPSAVLELAHDVAAAMLHLHSEGIVHGDLKAGECCSSITSAQIKMT